MAPAAAGAAQGEVCSVRVVARFRPPVSDAECEEERPAFSVLEGEAVESADLVQRFQFDRAFSQNVSQSEVYEDVGRPIVDDVLSGYNGTVLAYGPTGSGKTFCMFGPAHSRSPSDLEGLVPRAVQQVLDHAEMSYGREDCEPLSVECSFYEVYCEQVRDFLRPKLHGLQLKEMPGGGFSVEGLTHQKICTAAEALQILRSGLKLRVAANTKLNQHSSRSHAIFSLVLRQVEPQGVKQRKLTLVDLAGSEKVRKSGSIGGMLEEAKKINSSLSTLGHVIEALADRRPHVPYRDSRLTRLLEDSLGGNCRTTLLVACSPSVVHASETLSSLRFAARAKKVENCAKINNCASTAYFTNTDRQVRERIASLRREIARLEGRLPQDVSLIASTPAAAVRSRAASASAAAVRGSSPNSRSGRVGASPTRTPQASPWRSPQTPRATPRPLHRNLEEVAKDMELAERRQPALVKSASASSFSSATDRAPASDKAPPTSSVQAAIAAAFEAQRLRQQEMPEMLPVGSGVTLIGSCKSTATGSAASSTGSAAGFSMTGSATGTPLSHYRDHQRDESPLAVAPMATVRRAVYSPLIEATSLTDHTKLGKMHRPPLLPSASVHSNMCSALSQAVSSAVSQATLSQVSSAPAAATEEEGDQVDAQRLELESQRNVTAQLSARCAQLETELTLEREARHAERERHLREAGSLRAHDPEVHSAWPPASPSRGRLAAARIATMSQSQSHSLAHALGGGSAGSQPGSLSPSRRLVRYTTPLSVQQAAPTVQPQLSQPTLRPPQPMLLAWPKSVSSAGSLPVATRVTSSVSRTPNSMAVPSRTPSSSPVRMKASTYSAPRWSVSPSPRQSGAAVPVTDASGCFVRTRSHPARRLSMASPRGSSPSIDSLPRASVVSVASSPTASLPAATPAAVAESCWPPGILGNGMSTGERWSPRRSPSASRCTPRCSAEVTSSPLSAQAAQGDSTNYAAASEVREALSKVQL
eukprot:TRINITY_DN1801_c0_g1_i1.p1 TRINITY_DN1801_c0_g1~~TRINITY_DN1801_c0_g1_i1.p1  ORF type:complete len:987 (-),score=150.20 TRINITY_DN1801_c0_g1_i1:153-3113(-)